MRTEASCPICEGTGFSTYKSVWPVSLRRCDGCGVRFVWPLPTTQTLRERYAREHEAGKWEDLVDRGDPREPRRRAALLTRLANSSRRRLLDVGFGDGRFLDAAAEMAWQCAGIEVALEAARPLAHRHAVAVGTLASLRSAGSVDAITFWDVLEHVPDPGGMLRDAAAALAEDGLVAATMPSAGSLTARIEADRWRYYDLGTYGHLVHMTPRHLRMLFTKAGLTVVATETRGSVDLRHSLKGRGLASLPDALLDKLSGVLARVGVPLGYGNTLLMVGRKGGSGR